MRLQSVSGGDGDGVRSVIRNITGRPSIFNSFVVKDIFKFFQLTFDKVEDFIEAPKAS